MWRGCLILIAVYAAVFYLEYQQIQSLPFAGPVAALLALGLTLFLGSLQGLANAMGLRSQPQTDVSQWRDGEPIRVSGVLQPAGEALQAPISDRAAVFCSYSGRTPENDFGAVNREPPYWRGIMAAPCVLRAHVAKLAVLGIPSLSEVPRTEFHGRQHYPRAAHHLATTAWEVAPAIAKVPLAELGEMFSKGAAGLPPHLINVAALERLQMQIGRSSEAELLAQLETREWRFAERVVPPGSEVTLVGHFRASPPAIDINYGVKTPEHALYLGAAGKTAAGQLRTTLIFIVILGGLTAAAHHAVYANEGAAFRAALQALELTE